MSTYISDVTILDSIKKGNYETIIWMAIISPIIAKIISSFNFEKIFDWFINLFDIISKYNNSKYNEQMVEGFVKYNYEQRK